MLDVLIDKLEENKNKLFYKINEEEITYKELLKKSLELSDNLKKQGQEPIIIYGHKSITQVISIVACVIAKRCYIPIDLCTPINRIKDIIKTSKASLIIKNENLKLNNIECLTIQEINDKYKKIDYYYNINNNNAYVIFTSGSTGKAKGVPITYDNLNNFISWITNCNEFKNCNNLIVMSEASFAFDLSVMDLYFSIYKNASIIGIDNNAKNNLNILYNNIKENKINFLVMTPTFVKMLLIDEKFNNNNFPDIKYMFFCGETLEVTTAKKIKSRFSNVTIINAYGPTEATCCVSLIEIKNNMLNQEYLPVGKMNNPATEITIENGEIILSGKSVFDGYLENNAENINKIKKYHTKDIGEIKNNHLYCYGRLDNQIKYMGYRIELNDIENNLLKIEGISEAVVVCKYKENTNIVRLIKAYVVLDKEISIEAIKKELSKLIPLYMIPKSITILDEMPTTCNNKYDRRSLIKCD